MYKLDIFCAGDEGTQIRIFTNALCVTAGIPFLFLFLFWCCSMRLTGARGSNWRACCTTRNPVNTVNPTPIICLFWIITLLFVSATIGLTVNIVGEALRHETVHTLSIIFTGVLWSFISMFVCCNIGGYVCAGNYF